MAAKIRRTLRFFQLNPVTSDNRMFQENQKMISKIFSKKIKKYKHMAYGDGIVGIYDLKDRSSYILGTVYYKQDSNIPPSIDIDTNVDKLDLDDTKGLGYINAFLFHKKTNIIAIESNRQGVSINTLIKLIRYNFESLLQIEAAYVIDPVKFEEFLKTDHFKSIKIRYTKLQDGRFLNSNKESIKDMRNFADETNSDELLIHLKAPKRTGFLNFQKIIDIVKDTLVLKDSEEVTDLVVKGTDDESNGVKEFDFIKQKIIEFIFIEKQRLIGSFGIKERYDQIEQKFGIHHAKLEEAYSVIYDDKK